jgi:hypothetical protein
VTRDEAAGCHRGAAGPSRLPCLHAGVAGGAQREHVACPRCGAALHVRKPDSIARTWAFLLAAIILYIPANLLTMTSAHTLFGDQEDTIMSGVVYLWTAGSWPLAVIVFVASIMVPMLKIMALVFLLVSVKMRSVWQPDATHAALPPDRTGGPLVDARYLRHRIPRRAGATARPGHHQGGARGGLLRRRGRAHDVRHLELRPAPDLGSLEDDHG